MTHRLLPRAATAASTALLLAPARALAATGDLGERTPLHLDSGAQQSASGGGGGGIVRTIVGLAIVVAVIYGLAWVLRQVKSSREERTRGTGLTPCATIPLGPNRALHLIRVGREYVLVGAAEQGVMPIRTYTEAEAMELGLDAVDEPAPGPRRALPTGRPVAGLLDALRERTVRS